MQNKLTKDQRYYRKKKREARTDFTKITREDSKEVRRVSRRATTLRVSQEAAERFKQMAELYDVTQWQMATRIINFGLKPIVPSYAKYRKEEGGYEWREELLNPVDRFVRYKGDIGDVQLNLQITVTMWKKLRCHSTLTKQSMSRIFQRLCLDYKPLSPERLQKQRERHLADKARDDAYNRLATGEEAERIASIFVDIGGGIYEHKENIQAELWTEDEIHEYESLTSGS